MQSPNEMIGEIIAQRWQILTCLGEGNMSYVYKAQDTETGKVIVLKLIKEAIINKIPDLEVLAKQAKFFIALNHENISSYYDIHLNDKSLFLFCDYLNSEQLSTSLSKAGKIPLDKCVKLFTQIIMGLEYAHERKIFHGDLRPNNIYIVNDQFNTNEPKIVDFGFMHLIASLTENNKSDTTTNSLSNKSAYISPEQRLGKNIDERSDLYSLGCLMYEAACGRPPFSSKTAMEITYKQKNEIPTELQQLLPTEPLLLGYQSIANKLLHHNANERYKSASLVEYDLKLLASVKENEWCKKAYALKQPTYSMLTSYQWKLVFGAVVFSLLLFTSFILISIAGPYYSPWTNKFFDNNKLWLFQAKYSEAPSKKLLEQKDFLAKRLNEIAQKKGVSSPTYVQLLFSFSQYLVACKQFNEALAKLSELQNNEAAHGLLDPAELSVNMAFAQFAIGDLAHAEESAKMVLSQTNQVENKILAFKILGDLYNNKNEIVQAENMYKQMYSLARNNRSKNPAAYAYAGALLADIWRKENKLKESQQLYIDSIDWERNYVSHHQLFIARACYGLALVFYQENNWKAARLQLKQALPIAIEKLGEENDLAKSIKSLDDYALFHENILVWLKTKIDNH